MASGWDNGLSQDYNRKLGAWFADRLGAKRELRAMWSRVEERHDHDMLPMQSGLNVTKPKTYGCDPAEFDVPETNFRNMTHKTEGLEVVAWGIVAANTGRVCLVSLDADEVEMHKQQYIRPLVTLTSAQAAVATERKRWEEATLAIKAIGDANADSDCTRITALETALGVAREALEASNRISSDTIEALALIDAALGAKT